MLFRKDVLERIAAGEVTVAFRRWRRPSVRAGGRLRTRVGELAIQSVEPVAEEAIGEAEARHAGAPDRRTLLAGLPNEGTLYRIELRLAGPDPRVALRERTRLTGRERAELDARLRQLDRAGRDGPWTATVLGLIAERPGTRAADLAARLGREKAPFKVDVRKLKELGLTESLEVGYRLSPRGRAYLLRERGTQPREGSTR